MDNRHHSHNGFLAGVLFGVVLTLLFTTKRGRALLKELINAGEGIVESKLNLDGLDLFDEEPAVSEVEEDENNGKRIFKGVKKAVSKK